MADGPSSLLAAERAVAGALASLADASADGIETLARMEAACAGKRSALEAELAARDAPRKLPRVEVEASAEDTAEDQEAWWEEEGAEPQGVVESWCRQNCWSGMVWCDATAAETLRLCSSWRPRPAPVTVRFGEEGAVAEVRRPNSRPLQVEVTGEDSLDAAERLIGGGGASPPPLVLNMANATWCAGGFLKGCAGQEETLCRRSTLFCELAEAAYPLPPLGGLLTPEVLVIRGPGPEFRALPRPFRVAVATAAAPVRPDASTEEGLRRYEEEMAEKIRRLLLACASQGYRRLVLSAWGCGAFRNPPDVVARLFAAALGPAGLGGAFDHVTFAVMDRWGCESNREHFERAFRGGRPS